MHYLLIAVHVIVCIFMILVVLLQTGKGAEMGAAFGGSTQTIFGARGTATLMSKVTTVSAILFMLTSLSLAVISSKSATVIPESAVPAAMDKPAGMPPPAQSIPGAPAGMGGGPVSSPAPVATQTASPAAPVTAKPASK
ncbi:MAG: preprotein translocase subunit SecG [Nitrospirae bacterium]|nr:preprotein translocase subunit SecG [Nitrospirota bacterium]